VADPELRSEVAHGRGPNQRVEFFAGRRCRHHDLALRSHALYRALEDRPDLFLRGLAEQVGQVVFDRRLPWASTDWLQPNERRHDPWVRIRPRSDHAELGHDYALDLSVWKGEMPIIPLLLKLVE